MVKKNKIRNSFVKSKSHADLKPWLGFFKMFCAYAKLGYLQMNVAKHEAYVTQPAIHALSEGCDPKKQIEEGSVIAIAGRVRNYAAWLSGEGKSYLQTSFAVHIVKPDEPHDLMCTIVFARALRLFMWKDKVDVITYPKK